MARLKGWELHLFLSSQLTQEICWTEQSFKLAPGLPSSCLWERSWSRWWNSSAKEVHIHIHSTHKFQALGEIKYTCTWTSLFLINLETIGEILVADGSKIGWRYQRKTRLPNVNSSEKLSPRDNPSVLGLRPLNQRQCYHGFTFGFIYWKPRNNLQPWYVIKTVRL